MPRQAACHALPGRATAVLFAVTAGFLLLALMSQPAQSQTYKVIKNFTTKFNDGAGPLAGPILDRFGNLYGTTYLGGNYGSGSVYELSPKGSGWKFSLLYSFRGQGDGAGPAFGSLAIRNNNSLFGTTEGGGNFGTAFRVRIPLKRETLLHVFGNGQDGAQPIGGVAFDSAGNFYGTTSLGGTLGNGTVWQAKRSGNSWVENVIYNFTGGNDGTNPAAGATVDAQGNLYGTTSFGGAYGTGVVYELSPSGSGWTQTVLYNFQGLSDGQYPVGGVILDPVGNIFGTTFSGGNNGGGTVYELSPSGGTWTLTTLYSFAVSTYNGPYNKLTLDSKGILYGTAVGDGAYGFGSVFKLTPKNGSWIFTDLYDFTNGADGGLPYGSVAVDAHGNVFGTASTGGSQNQGVVFEITP